jgi:uncharacterized integral membrane protein (TIGR00697 family)
MFYRFGKVGLFSFGCICIILGNIQVLKAVNISFYLPPIALGNVVFTMAFVCSDLLTEYYGGSEARKFVGVSFFCFLAMTVLMKLTINFEPLPPALGDSEFFFYNHQCMQRLFDPMPAIFIASISAYIFSQLLDIYVFASFKNYDGSKKLWLRTFISSSIANFIDNALFSLLAWRILSDTPLSFNTIFYTHILGAFSLRGILVFVTIPFMYLASQAAYSKYNYSEINHNG